MHINNDSDAYVFVFTPTELMGLRAGRLIDQQVDEDSSSAFFAHEDLFALLG